MKVLLLFLSVSAVCVSSLPHHIPGHVRDTQPVLLAIQGVPVQVEAEGDHWNIKDYTGPKDNSNSIPGVIVPSNRVDGNLYVVQSELADQLFDKKQELGNIFLKKNDRKKRSGFSFTTPDGTSRQENVDSYQDPRVREPLNRITGRTSWVSPEGIPFTLDYVADGSGFHPSANHLPDSPNYRQFFVGRTEV